MGRLEKHRFEFFTINKQQIKSLDSKSMSLVDVQVVVVNLKV